MDVKKAGEKALDYLKAFFPNAQSITVEEVEISDDDRYWYITLGYDLPQGSAGLMSIGFLHRNYKVFKIDDQTGDVRSMKVRQIK